jgi:hypothetical protein
MVLTSLVRLCGVVLMSCSLSACGDSDTRPTPVDIAGTYNLVSANGRNLPAVVTENPATGFRQEVIDGSVELRSDRTFTVRTDYRITNGGDVRESASSDSGTYTLTDTAITFTSQPGSGRLSGTLRDGVLTVRADVELVYRK